MLASLRALCIADSEERSIPLEITADYSYFRLRDEGYQPADIVRWAHAIRDKTSSCRDVYVYFKHEQEGKGPDFARQPSTDRTCGSSAPA